MISGIEGILKSRGDDCVIIDVHGIAFRISIPASTMSAIGFPGDRVYLHTHLQVREDNLTLYGFASPDEIKLFELLIGVSGVGPKVALALISAFKPDQFSLAISTGSEDMLSSVSGVGKKTAARIVLELKGKFEHTDFSTPYIHEDAKAALIALGYSATEATSAMTSIPNSTDITLEDKIKLALKHFSNTK